MLQKRILNLDRKMGLRQAPAAIISCLKASYAFISKA